jgi:hypothetical protein
MGRSLDDRHTSMAGSADWVAAAPASLLGCADGSGWGAEDYHGL